VRNEIAVLKKVSMGHRNILTLVDYFETMNNRTRPDSRARRSDAA
jgi:calcium/calmodulin-dependent protein kinase I